MSFVTGLLLIDAPASALNNLGQVPGEADQNIVGVKLIRTREGAFPYVSAQAFRYWLRTTLQDPDLGWQVAPIYREENIAYTAADPIEYWDDDLFGYMRSPATASAAKKTRQADPEYQKLTPLETDSKGQERTVTRVSPFRVSTLVSIAPVTLTEDFGVMARQEKATGEEQYPIIHRHQFYRATLKGLFSLDLHACGTFWYRSKTGFRNLDSIRTQKAQQAGLIDLANQEAGQKEMAYRLPLIERVRRISTLLKGLAHLEGGAKQALHYTDVAPALVVLAVTKGGNHIFGHIVGANSKRQPQVKIDALKEALTVFQGDLLSDVYVGWVRGYLDEERATFEQALDKGGVLEEFAAHIQVMHPRDAFLALAQDLQDHSHWLE
jgi:CRISPR-associated protein Cst2